MNKKQILAILLYEFKKGRTEAETAFNINNVFGADTVTEEVAKTWFDKFRDGDETLDGFNVVKQKEKTGVTVEVYESPLDLEKALANISQQQQSS
ncbi:unnamed protein product [Bursaphelenchus okinawaensis]|uniref:Mos1 transposase HTH domain-containing protein n=1 Tax=Bursaphelenchus okinawaensis TaxID=465554 RepID=A0A811JS27_9BILA|nr:unnamed protein product [Bursaphelenchus okinawaensis]CAG9080003.1 unnamed protein product [Bursaphelenchus okinawaensis]